MRSCASTGERATDDTGAVRWAVRLAIEAPALEPAELAGALQSLIALRQPPRPRR